MECESRLAEAMTRWHVRGSRTVLDVKETKQGPVYLYRAGSKEQLGSSGCQWKGF